MPRACASALVQPDVGDLGRGVGAPRDGERARLPAAEEERVGEHDARQRVGHVRELEARGDVAGGVDAWVGGPQPVVDGDAVPDREATPAASRPRPSRLGARPAADEELVAATVRRRGPPPRSAPRSRRRGPRPAGCARRSRAWTPSRASRRSTTRRRRRPRAAGRARRRRSTVTSAPKRRNVCASSQPIGPPPMTTQAPRQLGQLEDRLVGEVAGLGEPRDGWHGGARAGRDDGARELEPTAVHLDASSGPTKRPSPR